LLRVFALGTLAALSFWAQGGSSAGASWPATSVGHLSLKLAARSLQALTASGTPLLRAVLTPWLALGIALHVAALDPWVMGLRRVELSITYPFIVLARAAGPALWGVPDERPQPASWLGLTLIVTGVLVVAR
jgi:hypothetical protein